jgi:hypothetical protein
MKKTNKTIMRTLLKNEKIFYYPMERKYTYTCGGFLGEYGLHGLILARVIFSSQVYGLNPLLMAESGYGGC